MVLLQQNLFYDNSSLVLTRIEVPYEYGHIAIPHLDSENLRIFIKQLQ